MPAVVEKKSTTRKSTTKEEVAVPATAPVVEETKKSVKKSAPAAEPVPATPAPAVAETKEKKARKEKKEETLSVELPAAAAEVIADASEDAKNKRRVVTKESVQHDFDALETLVQNAITTLSAEGKPKFNDLRFARSVAKSLKALRADVNRVAKVKRADKARPANSGFMKPVKISKKLAEFTGWDEGQLRSRVDVTKYICSYIKENKLQDTQDRRKILPDPKLTSLLGYDRKKDGKDLTYYYIQTKLKPHFLKAEEK